MVRAYYIVLRFTLLPRKRYNEKSVAPRDLVKKREGIELKGDKNVRVRVLQAVVDVIGPPVISYIRRVRFKDNKRLEVVFERDEPSQNFSKSRLWVQEFCSFSKTCF